MDDDSLEGMESFNIKIVLDTAAPNNSAVLLRPDTTTVYISDNDGKWKGQNTINVMILLNKVMKSALCLGTKHLIILT